MEIIIGIPSWEIQNDSIGKGFVIYSEPPNMQKDTKCNLGPVTVQYLGLKQPHMIFRYGFESILQPKVRSLARDYRYP